MFLDTLERLMENHNLNKNTLAKESGIPYTTIDGFWKKGYDNIKLSTLLKLSEYFQISLDSLLDRQPYSDICDSDEKEILTQYRTLDAHGREVVRTILVIENKRIKQFSEMAPQEKYLPRKEMSI